MHQTCNEEIRYGKFRGMCVAGAADAIVKQWSMASGSILRSYDLDMENAKSTAVTSIDVVGHVMFVGYASGTIQAFDISDAPP